MKTQKKYKVPRWYEIPIQSHMMFLLQNHPHMQLVISLSFVKLLWPLVRFISYSHDQDHVHVSTTCYASTLEVSKYPSIHKIKIPRWRMTPLSQKVTSRIWGYAKRNKKRFIPKEGMPYASACQKKKRNKKMHTIPHA